MPPVYQVLSWALHMHLGTSQEPNEVGKVPVKSEENETKGGNLSKAYSIEMRFQARSSVSIYMAARAAPPLGHSHDQTITGSVKTGSPGVTFHTNQLPTGRLTDGVLPPKHILTPTTSQCLHCQC